MLKREISVIVILIPLFLFCFIGLCYCGDEREFIPLALDNLSLGTIIPIATDKAGD